MIKKLHEENLIKCLHSTPFSLTDLGSDTNSNLNGFPAILLFKSKGLCCIVEELDCLLPLSDQATKPNIDIVAK